jgi:hypothetical protein
VADGTWRLRDELELGVHVGGNEELMQDRSYWKTGGRSQVVGDYELDAGQEQLDAHRAAPLIRAIATPFLVGFRRGRRPSFGKREQASNEA